MDFTKLDGLIPAVVQDDETGEVLMVGFMNDEAWERTLASGFVTFFSRTRRRLWMKGETSGNRLRVTSLLVDCDDDTVLLKVQRLGEGNVCHTGERSCFRRMTRSGSQLRVSAASEPGARPAFAPQALRRVRRSFSGGGSGAWGPREGASRGVRGAKPSGKR